MTTCGSFSLWCAICVLAALTSFGMSQVNDDSQQMPRPDNCTAFNASSCHSPDLNIRRFCLSNGSIVAGFCEAQEAICGNRLQLQRDITLCSSKDTSSTTSRTTATTGRSTTGSTFNQRDRTDDHHDHDHKDGQHDDDNGAPHTHTSCHVIVLCGFTAAAYATRLFSLL